jgi:predicted dehydrogenase
MVRIGFAGMGYIGQVHYAAARKINGVEVVAVADQRPPNELQVDSGVKVYSDYGEFLRATDLDAIIVCVPTFLHEQFVIDAVRRQRHVLCEKPFALNAAAAGRMAGEARKAGAFLMVAQVLRFWPQYAQIKRLAGQGAIGQIRSISAHRLSKYAPWATWFRDPEKSGGCLLDMQVHDVDYAYWLLGMPSSVETTGLKGQQGGWDHVFTKLKYPHAVVNIESSYMMPESWPMTAGIRVDGESGCLEYRFRSAGNVQERDEAEDKLVYYPSDGVASEPESPAEDCFLAELRYFVDCVRAGTAPADCPTEGSLDVMRIMDASKRSAETGAAVELGPGGDVV